MRFQKDKRTPISRSTDLQLKIFPRHPHFKQLLQVLAAWEDVEMKIARALSYILGISLGVWATSHHTGHELGHTGLSPGSMKGFYLQEASQESPPSLDRPAVHSSRLRPVKGSGSHQLTLASLHAAHRPMAFAAQDGPFQNISSIGDYSTQYAIQCQWDATPVWLIFDTGSSDTWTARTDFECLDNTGEVHEQAACELGKPYVGDFGHGPADDLHFFLRYGSGERVSGPMGYSDLSCGGLTVSKQQVGLANNTYWHGNNVTNGILGLAYPSLTSAYYGNIGDEAPWNAVSYPPFFTTAVAQGTIDPLFSVAIMRNSSEGILAWGGLPPLPYDSSVNATSNLLIVSQPPDVAVAVAAAAAEYPGA